MKDCTDKQLFEIDRCFQYVLERIKADGVHPRTVLFGSTVDRWFRSSRGCRMKIVITGTPPNGIYETATI